MSSDGRKALSSTPRRNPPSPPIRAAGNPQSSAKDGADLPGDLEVLAGAHDEGPRRRVARRDVGVVVRRLVGGRVDRDAEEREAVGGRGPDRGGPLADAAGEDERVEPPEGGGHRGDRGPEAMDVDVEREARVASVRRL